MEIYFSLNKDVRSVLRIPYVPPEASFSPRVSSTNFETAKGKILTLTGEKGLRNLKINSFFPSKIYLWLPNIFFARECVNFFEKNRTEIFRVVIVGLSGISHNFLCTIKNFEYKEKQNLDVDYSLEVEEYLDPNGGAIWNLL